MPVPNIQWITPDDGQRNCPKRVEFRTRINLEISASVGVIVKKFITMHGHMNVKSSFMVFISCVHISSLVDDRKYVLDQAHPV